MWEWASATHSAACEVAVLYDVDLYAQSSLRNPAIPLLPLQHTGTGRIRVPRRLASTLTSDDILVLHSTYIPGNISAAWSARRQGIPYIVVPHGGYNKRARERRHLRKGAWQPVERVYLEGALAVHVFFENETRDIAEMAPNARWIVAPTGYALPAERWDGGTGGYLAWLGRYDICTKGLDLLVHAMSRLPESERRPLRTHGKRSENSAEDLERIVRESGLTDIVTVGGELRESEKANFLRRAAAYVHPSRWESHSLGLVEALAYGMPVVVSARCVIAPHLRAADAAVVVEPTPDGIARGISAILRSPQQYCDRAIQFVQTSLSWNAIMGDYLRQIESLRGGRQPPLL
jgi:glycosyltransferase involved in cell wall biosynthesis